MWAAPQLIFETNGGRPFRSAANHKAVVPVAVELNFELHLWLRPIFRESGWADWDKATLTERARAVTGELVRDPKFGS
jgi:hypothetical protein